jgi:DNA-binding GntR family transcriptional regulator
MRSPADLLMRDIAAEHRALLNAALERDPRATGLLRDHLTRTWTFVAGVFAQNSQAPEAR